MSKGMGQLGNSVIFKSSSHVLVKVIGDKCREITLEVKNIASFTVSHLLKTF